VAVSSFYGNGNTKRGEQRLALNLKNMDWELGRLAQQDGHNVSEYLDHSLLDQMFNDAAGMYKTVVGMCGRPFKIDRWSS
jgi:hypothetical protein